MAVTAGIHHVALLTEDLDRFVAFYHEVFDAALVANIVEEHGMRHAMVEVGQGAVLHAFEQPERSDARGSAVMFGRGHLDHLALNVPDREAFEDVRARLVEVGASDGTITDFGSVCSVSFLDPDGTDAEIALWQDGEVLTYEQRRQIPYPARP